MPDEIREEDNLAGRRKDINPEEQLRHLEDKAAIVLGVAGGICAVLVNMRLPEYLVKLSLPAMDVLLSGTWVAIFIAVWLSLNAVAAERTRSEVTQTAVEPWRLISRKATLIEASIRCLSVSVAFLALQYVWPPSRSWAFGLLFIAGLVVGAITVIMRPADGASRFRLTTLMRFGWIPLALGISVLSAWLNSMATWHGIGLVLGGCLAGSQIAELGSQVVSRVNA